MTEEQFEDIKKVAWSLYRGNMLEWAIKTLKGTLDSPKWIKEMLNGIELDNLLNNEDFLEQYEDEIETLLVASQEVNFEVNYSKRLTEFFEAKRDNDEDSMVYALCNMVIVAINSGFGNHSGESMYIDFYKNRDENENLVKCFVCRDTINPLLANIEKLGYNPYLCLLETIKELKTRTCVWNEEQEKLAEFIGQYNACDALDLATDICIEKYGEIEFDVKLENEDEEYWYFHCNAEGGKSVKVKKWYKANYNKCK